MTTLDVLLIGFGSVGRRFVTLIEEEQAILRRSYGLTVRVIGIATAHHGSRLVPAGLSVARAAALARRIEAGGRLGSARRGGRGAIPSSGEFIASALRHRSIAARARQGRVIVAEATTLDIECGQPAIAHVKAALAGHAHVISVNKGPASFAYHELSTLAAAVNRRFLFEGAVMDGVPIFSLVRDTLPANPAIGFRGVVNSTTNYILTSMEAGLTFEQALADMQAAGIAEADASLDVDGWDAAAKTAALANVLLDAGITPHDVLREGLGTVSPTRVAAARVAGRRLKLIASAERTARGVRARVGPMEIPASDLLAGLEGQQNAIVLKTALLGEIAIVQRGAGLTQTAYALLSDLITVGRGISGAATGLTTAGSNRRASASAHRGRSHAPRGRR